MRYFGNLQLSFSTKCCMYLCVNDSPVIYHCLLVLLMLPLSLLARHFFRRPQDASRYASGPEMINIDGVNVALQARPTSTKVGL